MDCTKCGTWAYKLDEHRPLFLENNFAERWLALGPIKIGKRD